MDASVPAAVVRRLLFAADPIPGQSLLGVVCEAARDNGHRTMAHVLAAAGYPHHAHYDLAVARPELLARLAAVLRLSPDEVLSRAHPLIDAPHGWGAARVDFAGTPVWAYDLDFRRRRVAPGSLAVSSHHRTTWTHSLVPHCTESGDWLIDACPSCGGSLGWRRAVDAGRCDRCRADLRDHAGRGPDAATREALDPVLDLLATDPGRHGPALARLRPDLRELGRGGAFELGWRIAAALHPAAEGLPRDRHHKLGREEIVAVLGSAGSILHGWPSAIEDRLRPLGQAGEVVALTDAVRRLRHALHRRRTWPEIAALVERRHPDVFGRTGLKTRTVVLARTPGLLNGTGAVEALGTGSRKFAAIHRANLVEAVTSTGVVNAFKTFSQADLAVHGATFADRMPDGEAKFRLGVSFGGLEQLACLGALAFVDDPVVLAAYAGPQLSRASVTDLERRLVWGADAGLDAGIPLRVAMRAVGGEKPWGPVLLAMAEGRLPFTLRGGEDALSRRILLTERHAPLLREARFDPGDHPGFAFATTMTRIDAAEVLNVSPPTMMRVLARELAGAGAGGADAGGKLLDRAKVARLATERISSREILVRWCGGGRRLPSALSAPEPLHRLGPAGWDRSAVLLRLARDGDR